MKLLKEIREKRGISQWTLAQKMGLTSPQYVSNIERGVSVLPAKHIKQIADALGRNKKDKADIQKQLIEARVNEWRSQFLKKLN